jgi:hypothetical protein
MLRIIFDILFHVTKRVGQEHTRLTSHIGPDFAASKHPEQSQILVGLPWALSLFSSNSNKMPGQIPRRPARHVFEYLYPSQKPLLY